MMLTDHSEFCGRASDKPSTTITIDSALCSHSYVRDLVNLHSQSVSVILHVAAVATRKLKKQVIAVAINTAIACWKSGKHDVTAGAVDLALAVLDLQNGSAADAEWDQDGTYVIVCLKLLCSRHAQHAEICVCVPWFR